MVLRQVCRFFVPQGDAKRNLKRVRMATISIELRGIDSATQVVNNVKVSLNQLHSQAQTAGDGIAGSLRRIGESAAGFLVAQAIPAITDMGRQALAVATDYQSAMNIMQAVSGATAEQMALVGQRAKELGADMTLPATSAGDAALTMVELAKAGLSVEQSMAAARGALQLSAAGAIGNAEAAKIAATAMNAFGLAGDQVSSIANMFAAAANASSVEVRGIGDAFAMSAAVFSAFQAPVVGAQGAIQDLTTAIAVLGNAGIEGSDAGTSLKQMLLQLTGPSDKAKDAMRALYLATNEAASGSEFLTAAISGGATARTDALEELTALSGAAVGAGDIAFDASGKMRSLADIVQLTAQATRGMTEEQRAYAVTSVFGADASRAIIALMRSMGEEAQAAGNGFQQIRDKLDNQGAAAQLAAARMAGLGGAFQGLQSQIETALLALAEPALPFLEGIVRQIAEAVPRAVEQVQILGSQIQFAIASFMAGFAEGGLGTGTFGLLQAIGLSTETAAQASSLVSQIQASVQTGLTQIQAAWAANGPAISAFAMQMLGVLGQVALFLAGQLPAAIGATASVIAFFITNWQAVATVLGVVAGVLVGGGITAAVGAITAAIGALSAAALGWGLAFSGIVPITTAVGWAIAALGGPITLTIALVAGLAVAWSTNFMGIQTTTLSAWSAIQSAFSAGSAALVASTAMWWAAVQITWTTASTAITTATSTAWAAIQTAWTMGTMAIQVATAVFWAAVQTQWSTFTTSIQTTTTMWWLGIQTGWTAATVAIQVATQTWWTGVQTTWTNATTAVQTATSMWWLAIQTLWAAAVAALLTQTSTWWSAVQTNWTNTTTAIQTTTTGWWNAIQTNWNAATGAVQATTNSWWSAIQTTWSNATSAVQSTTASWWSSIQSGWNAATSAVQSTTVAWWTAIQTQWTNATTAVQTATTVWWAALGALWLATTAAIQAQTTVWWGQIQALFQVGFGLIQGLTQEAWGIVQGIWNEAVSFVSGLMDRLGGAFEQVTGAIKGTISALKKLADTAASIGDAIPDWMRPGSPMPLGIAFEHLASTLPNAAAAMGQFGDAARGASSAPVVDIRLLLNGQTVASAGTFGSTLAAVIEALVMPLAGLHEAIDSRVAGTLQRVSDSLKHVQTMFETVFKIIGLIAEAPTLPNVGPNSPTLQFVRNATSWALAVATAAANSAAVFEEVKTAGLQALATAAGQVKTLLEGAFALIGLATNPPALTSVAPGSATLVWFGNVTTWTRAVTTASAQAAAGFETLETAGLQAVTAAAGLVKTLIENAHKLVTLSTDPPGLTSVAVGSATLTWFGNVTTWTRAVTTAAAAAAAGFEDVKTGGLPAMVAASGQVVTLIETARKLIELSTRPPALTSVAVGSVVLTWFANVTTWTRTVTTAAAQAATGFETLETTGLQAVSNAVGPVRTLVEGVLALVSLTMRPPTLPQVPQGSALYSFFRDVAGWARGVTTLAANAAAGFEELRTEGLTAVTTAAGQVKTLIDAVLSIVEQVAFPPMLPVIAAGSSLHTFLVSLLGFARTVAQIAAETAAGFETVVLEGLQALAKAVGDALKVLKDTLDLLIVANTEFNIPTNFADTIKLLTQIGIQMAGAYLEVASTFTGIVTPAATEAAKAMDMAAKFIKDVYDLAKQIVKDPPAFPSNFQDLIRRLVQMGKEIAVVFIDEANTFATNVGPGAVALLTVYDKMDDFFKGFNKAVNAVSDIASVPTDAAAKVRTVMAAAVAIANEYITAANGFTGAKGQGATNLEGIIAGFQQLMKSVKDVLKTLDDWGTAGVQSDEIAPALAIFASILASLESMVNTSGVTAGTGYIVRFAENVRSNATLARDALLEVMVSLIAFAGAAGRGAGLSFMAQMAAGILAGADIVKAAVGEALGGASAGASKAADSAGKAAAASAGSSGGGGGTTTINNDNRSTTITINVVNTSAAAARATNEGIGSLPLFN